MRCAVVHSLSSEYLDGALDEARASALRGHLRTCEACAARLADEQALLAAATELASKSDPMLEPPASLWKAIGEGLAAEEIADSRSSLARIWMRRLSLVVFPYRAHIAATAALLLVVGALVIKQSQDVIVARRAVAGASGASFASFPPSVFASDAVEIGSSETQLEAAMREIRRADRRYLSTIVELRDIASEDRDAWSAETRRRYDEGIAAFERRAEVLRAEIEPTDGDPRARDGLYRLYRGHIKFLEEMVFQTVSALGATR